MTSSREAGEADCARGVHGAPQFFMANCARGCRVTALKEAMKSFPVMSRLSPVVAAALVVLLLGGAMTGAWGGGEPQQADRDGAPPVKLPGLEIKVGESCVDVSATVCLDEQPNPTQPNPT